MINNYDDWKLDTPQNKEKVFAYCEACGREIYYGENYMWARSLYIHEDCIESKVAGE